MSEQANQEKVTLTKEQMNEVLEARMNDAMNALLDDGTFSDEQRGEIKVWMKQIYYLGKEHGKAEAVVGSIPEEAIDKFVGIFDKVAGIANPEGGGEDHRLEALLYKSLYHQEQQISSSYHCQAIVLQQKLDGTLGKPNAFTCLGTM